ncbi:tRNA lysidine(34) synthetase TilS [Parasphingopyxis sp. CP4]|uniref:tRNA lysidine(34) synthetase TilS n=1 Tax=Parasphingopyxis sp. CP4 TaxID=2724527 RepID=UPI0015A20B5A|nr:tRNA lysidine(34) synthetase TilS [Parasphingopyxis sp. CP4]QLC22095.1 tRNA lysidine(34) synthetase TilS [Parasphingopyxis sp. CP4]
MTQSPLLDRFRTATEALTGTVPSRDRRLGIAVSGGPDSMALLALAAEAYSGAVSAATIDHGLRPEAAEEAEHVAAICRQLDIPHAILTPAEPIKGNLQSSAREARYALLGEWRSETLIEWIATAHHADDQLETVLMRLLRGSGVDGLSAIRPINGAIIRPLLGVRKAELSDYLETRDIAAVSDPSNTDRQFDRVRMRDALADFPDFDPERIELSIAAMRDASEALEWMTDQAAATHINTGAKEAILTPVDLPNELLRRLVQRCLNVVDPEYPRRGEALDRTIAALLAGKNCTIGQILCAVEKTGNWRFSAAPPRKTG